MELHSVTYPQIIEGNFPLNHDCILIVYYFPASGLSKQFFTCRAPDSGSISLILEHLFCVQSVNIYSVDNFNL